MPTTATFEIKVKNKESDVKSEQFEVTATDKNGNILPKAEQFREEDLPPNTITTKVNFGANTEIVGISVFTYNPTTVCIHLSNGQLIYIKQP
jgi:hypothetical protein